MSREKTKFAVLISGYGRGAIEIINDHQLGRLKSLFSVLISNNPNSHALTIASNAEIPTCILELQHYPDRSHYEDALLHILNKFKVDYIFLAGYGLLIGKKILSKFPKRIVNIHPSLLPSFKGHKNGIQQALDYGVKVTGVTVHFIDEQMDRGEIIAQSSVIVNDSDDFTSLDRRISSEGFALTRHVINTIFVNKIIYDH